MAKRIVILEYAPGAQTVRIDCVLWAQVPAARQPFYANANAQSAYRDASAEERDAIRAGQIAERVAHFEFPSTMTAEEMEAQAVADWAAFQIEIENRNPWALFGSHYDDDQQWYFTGVS